MPELRHRGRAVGRHGGLAVFGVVFPAGGFRRFAVAAEIEQDYGVERGEVGCYEVPY